MVKVAIGAGDGKTAHAQSATSMLPALALGRDQSTRKIDKTMKALLFFLGVLCLVAAQVPERCGRQCRVITVWRSLYASMPCRISTIVARKDFKGNKGGVLSLIKG